MSADKLNWVDVLLSKWGRWAIRCESGALGFASSCILAGAGDGDSFDSAIPKGVIDGDLEAVDGAVRRLPFVIRITVIQVYQWGQGKSDRHNAQALGVDRNTVNRYLVLAHQKIALDISLTCRQNAPQSVNGGNALRRNQPVRA
jgi:hypothetical protein